jgi:hypothetical protein
MIATVINVVVPRTMQDRIYLAMAEGNIQLARVETQQTTEEEPEKGSVVASDGQQG